MNRLFCDTSYFAALVNPKDQWHQNAINVEDQVEASGLVTTEDVLIEFLNYHCEFGSSLRSEVSKFTRTLLLNLRMEIVARNEFTFLTALDLYESRLDKGYSLTDCISMNVCRQLKIDNVLTTDGHFRQEGFSVLL